MAAENPLGVGANNFSSAYGRWYIPPDETTLIEWGRGRWLSAHSVYFRALGEYGVPGLVILLSLLVVNVRGNCQLAARIRSMPSGLPEQWPLLVNVSLVGYAVGGMFLGGLTYPHLYLLSGLGVAGARLVERDGHSAAPQPAASPWQEANRSRARRGWPPVGSGHGVPTPPRWNGSR
jgi:O-antigen ligase